MRLTADLIRNAAAYMNPLNQRELNLRGYKIPVIENLGVTQDQYELLDISDNEVAKMHNFPLLKRLETLLLNNNRITRITAGLSEFLPKLDTLILTNNKLNDLKDLDALAQFANLTCVSVMRNPASKRANYRLYVISKLPKLKILDFQKVKQAEREAAKKMFGDAKKKSADSEEEEEDADTQMGDAEAPKMTAEDRKKIMEAIKNATSLEEIERLESILSSGKGLPADL